VAARARVGVLALKPMRAGDCLPDLGGAELAAFSGLGRGLLDLPVDSRDKRPKAHSAGDLFESRVVSVG
jgi:hypothetical protein